MSANPLKDHGRAILETAKDHLVGALENAPDEGWTAVDWAQAAGLLLDGSTFPAVFAHHIAPVLVKEGRARQVGEGGLARYSTIQQSPEIAPTVVAAATTAPQVWGTAPVDESDSECSADDDLS